MTFTIPVFGMLGDRFGARRVCGWGGLLLAVMAVPIFMAVGSGSLFAYSVAAFVAMALNYAMMIAPQSSLYAAQFPPELRYSGLSIGVQFSAAIGVAWHPWCRQCWWLGSTASCPWARTWRCWASLRARRRS